MSDSFGKIPKLNLSEHKYQKGLKEPVEIIFTAEANLNLSKELKIYKFIAFNSKYNKSYLIYSQFLSHDLLCYDLNEKQLILKLAINQGISFFKHLYDEINNRDIIMVITIERYIYIKLYNFENYQCFLTLKFMFSDALTACFLKDNNQYYIVCGDRKTGYSNWNDDIEFDDSQEIEVYDFEGKRKKKIKNSASETYSLDTYYEDNKIYIIAEKKDYYIVYDYKCNEFYQKYPSPGFICVIRNKDNITRFIRNCNNNIELFNFHNGSLLQKIDINDYSGIRSWNNDYLLIKCKDGSFKVIEVSTCKIIDAILKTSQSENTIKTKLIVQII